MQSRYKILIFFTALFALGSLTLFYFGNDNNVAVSFRSLFFGHAISNPHPTLSFVSTGAWYGIFSLFAIITIVLVCRIVWRHNFQWHNGTPSTKRAAAVGPAPVQAGASNPTRPELQRMAELLQEKDATITDLENSLRARQELLENRRRESDALKAKMKELTEQLADFRLAKERAENTLQREIKKTKIFQAKDSIIDGLENSLTETQKHLQERRQEVDTLKFQMNTLTEQLADFRLAKERAENILQREIKKTKIFEETDPVISEPTEGSSGRVYALERELSEQQELLRTRSRELKAARSKVNNLREQLSALRTAKSQAENVLQQQLKQKTELLQAKDAAIKDLQGTLSAKVQALETPPEEKQEFGARRVKDLEWSHSEGSSPALVKKRARSRLLQELQRRAELLEAKEILVKDLQGQLNAMADALEDARRELKNLATERDAGLGGALIANGPAKEREETFLLRADRKGMNSKLLELGATKARESALLQSDETKDVENAGMVLTNKTEKLRTDSGTE